VAVLVLAGTAQASEKREDQHSMVARAMAVAEIDFELHLAQLGLVGSSLLSEERKAEESAVSAEKPASTTAAAPTTPAAAEAAAPLE